ncbi:MAG: hypothetical protein HS116_28725 [Planctomycetes bacterium]|nr:hypothetical protein [Planctomycetota bacterium]
MIRHPAAQLHATPRRRFTQRFKSGFGIPRSGPQLRGADFYTILRRGSKPCGAHDYGVPRRGITRHAGPERCATEHSIT